HRRRRAAARAARRAGRVPRVASGTAQLRLGGRDQAQLRSVGAAEADHARGPEADDDLAVGPGHGPELGDAADARVERVAGRMREKVLEEVGDAPEGPGQEVR